MSNLIRWNAFQDLENFHKSVANWFGQPTRAMEFPDTNVWQPLVDVTEDDKEYTLKAELPDMKQEDIKVSLENGLLSISGERKLSKDVKDKKYHRIERSYGSFTRTFSVPTDAETNKVEAKYDAGVLTVHIPKLENAKPRQIEVKVK